MPAGKDDDAPEAEAPEAPTERSFADRGRLRRPTRAEINRAVDATPTLEDQRPAIPVPSYLKKDGDGRLSGAISKGTRTSVEGRSAPGFTDQASYDATLLDASLSAPVIEPPSTVTRASPRSPLIWVTLGLAVVAAVLLVLVLR